MLSHFSTPINPSEVSIKTDVIVPVHSDSFWIYDMDALLEKYISEINAQPEEVDDSKKIKPERQMKHMKKNKNCNYCRVFLDDTQRVHETKEQSIFLISSTNNQSIVTKSSTDSMKFNSFKSEKDENSSMRFNYKCRVTTIIFSMLFLCVLAFVLLFVIYKQFESLSGKEQTYSIQF